MPGIILVVDDDPDIRDALAEVLADQGIESESVCDGRQALSWLFRHEGSVDLILLDLRMPDMDGETFLQIKEADPGLTAVPVIVLTADVRLGEGLVALYRSVRCCLSKPLTSRDLLEAIRAIRG